MRKTRKNYAVKKCPMCSGEPTFLGQLGALRWWRCRSCGYEYSSGKIRRRKVAPKPRSAFKWKATRAGLVGRQGRYSARIWSPSFGTKWRDRIAYGFEYKVYVGKDWRSHGTANLLSDAKRYAEETLYVMKRNEGYVKNASGKRVWR